MLDQLIVYQKTFDLIVWLYPLINKFPKSQRFVLGQRIEQRALAILESVVLASTERYKLPHVKKALLDLDVLRVLLRLAHTLHFISTKQYGVVAERVNEVGKLLGGFLHKPSGGREG